MGSKDSAPSKSPIEKKTWRAKALFRLSADLAEVIEEKDVCQRVVDGLHATLGYDYIALFILDETTNQRNLAASVGFNHPATPLLPGQGLSEAPFLTGKIQYTADVTKDERYSYGVGGSEVDVPIWIGDTVKGGLVIESKQTNAFDQDDFDVLIATAHITGLAIDKSRIVAEERKRGNELEALRATMTEITAELDLPTLLRQIVERAATLLNATGGELGLYNEENEEIRIVVSHNLGKDYVGSVQKLGEGLMGKVAESCEALIIDDYLEWSGKLPEYDCIYSSLGVPLIVGKRLLGIFTTVTTNKKRKFDSNDLHLLNLFAHQAAIAIENARLFKQTQKEIDQRKKILKEVSHQKEYYEALLVNNPEAVVTANPNGAIISWNPSAEKLFGYTYDEVVGNNLDDFVANHESIRQDALRNTNQVINEGQVQSTCKRTRKDGSFVDVELLALPIIVAEEKIGFIAIYHDLTEIKTIERELRKKNDKMSRELALAGEIQASFLPRNLPNIKGWQISSILKSASETSGDFFDIRYLPNGNLSILIADVIDKGVGAALFMSLCWSLFRIISDRFETKPHRVFSEINRRILTDTKSGQFVTVFYGVLDPKTGEFIYCSAGHCPIYIIKNNKSKDYLRLTNTGMPIGIEKNEKWDQKNALLEEGDFMVLYTDGIIEGENQEGEFYGEKRLRKVLQENSGESAEAIKKHILEDLHKFLGNRPQSDDIALIVIKRGN